MNRCFPLDATALPKNAGSNRTISFLDDLRCDAQAKRLLLSMAAHIIRVRFAEVYSC